MLYRITFSPRPGTEVDEVALDDLPFSVPVEKLLQHREFVVYGWTYTSLAQAAADFEEIPDSVAGKFSLKRTGGESKYKYIEYDSELWKLGFRTQSKYGDEVYRDYRDLPVPEPMSGFFAHGDNGIQLFTHMSREHVIHAIGEDAFLRPIPKEGRSIANPETFTESFVSSRGKENRWIDQSTHDLIQTHNAINPPKPERIKAIIRDILEMREYKFKLKDGVIVTT